jgi:cobalt/nickel transport system ATP-binding protein
VSSPAVAVRELRFRYPGRATLVLDGLSLEVGAGERVAVLGANGSGKTTLLLHLIGLLEPEGGEIEIGGVRLDRSSVRAVRQQVGLVFQDADDQLFMATVRDDVAFGPANQGVEGPDLDRRVHEALGAVAAGELADRTPHRLSGGEKRRAALATALAMAPAVLALDEPTSGLDPVGRRELAGVLGGLAAAQLIVTHDLPFALETCPRSVIVDAGRVVADGPTWALLADAELLARHHLELPFGYPPPTAPPR